MTALPLPPAPPRWAERLLRWSLWPADRPAVLGDLQEEFETLASSDPRAAVRWYWRQTVTSLLPNATRQLRRRWAAARSIEDDTDRDRRRGLRKFGGWMIGLGAFMSGTSWAMERTLTWSTPGLTIVAIGLVYGAASGFRRLPTAGQWGRSRRGHLGWALWLLFWMVGWLGANGWTRATDWQFAISLMLVLILVWPRAAWPFRRRLPVREYSLRSPRVFYRDPDGNMYDTMTVPASPLAMSPPIVGLAEPATVPKADRIDGVVPMTSTISRTFTPDASLRLFTVVNADWEHLQARLELHRAATGRLIGTVPASVSRATPKLRYRNPVLVDPDDEVPAIPSSPVSEVNVVVTLAGLAPGEYTLRLVAADGDGSSFQDTEITVRGSEAGPR